MYSIDVVRMYTRTLHNVRIIARESLYMVLGKVYAWGTQKAAHWQSQRLHTLSRRPHHNEWVVCVCLHTNP